MRRGQEQQQNKPTRQQHANCKGTMMEGQDDAIQVKHKPTDKDCELAKNLVPPDLSGLSSFAQLWLF